MNPKIRIGYGWHLDGFFRRFIELNPEIKKKSYPSREEVEAKIKDYKDAWEKIENKVLTAISEILKLKFYQKVIDVYIVGSSRSFSDPMIISSHFLADEFCDVLVHELIHRILTDNTKHADIASIWKNMFPKEPRLVRNHVLVHATHEYIYREILKDDTRLKRDISNANDFPEYKRSWDIVEEKGYQQVIERFKNYYLKE